MKAKSCVLATGCRLESVRHKRRTKGARGSCRALCEWMKNLDFTQVNDSQFFFSVQVFLIQGKLQYLLSGDQEYSLRATNTGTCFFQNVLFQLKNVYDWFYYQRYIVSGYSGENSHMLILCYCTALAAPSYTQCLDPQLTNSFGIFKMYEWHSQICILKRSLWLRMWRMHYREK